MDWFMEQIRRGFFNVTNPFTKTRKKVDISRDLIHSIVFWSKNYDDFIRKKAGEKLLQLGFNLYFNFTINSESSLLEPHIPPLRQRFEQLKQLVSRFGSQCISWRFDPICFYHASGESQVKNNLTHFPGIAREVSKCGITTCVTSFFDDYSKIRRRLQLLKSTNQKTLSFIDPPMEKKKQVIHKMEHFLAPLGISTLLCCEKSLFSTLDTGSGVMENACINGNWLKTRYGGNPETRKDYGQRSKQGCQCSKAIDIGSYEDHPCFHNCLFCYANTQTDTIIKKTRANR